MSREQLLRQIKAALVEKNISPDSIVKKSRDKKIALASRIIRLLGIDSIEKLRFELNPPITYKKTYIILDTRNARFLDNNTKIQWTLSNSIVEFDNSTNIKNQILNIREIRIRSFYTSKIYLSTALRATMYIEEFGNDAILGQDGNKYHFLFLINATTFDDTDVENYYRRSRISYLIPIIETDPDQPFPFEVTEIQSELIAGYRFNEGRYRFNKPVNLTSTITISMTNPFSKITWPMYTALANFTVTSATTLIIVFPQFHGFPNGYRIVSLYLPFFNTSDPISDANKINAIRNIEIQQAIVSSPTNINIDIVTSSNDLLVSADPNLNAAFVGTPLQSQVFLTGYRYYIEMEISSEL